MIFQFITGSLLILGLLCLVQRMCLYILLVNNLGNFSQNSAVITLIVGAQNVESMHAEKSDDQKSESYLENRAACLNPPRQTKPEK